MKALNYMRHSTPAAINMSPIERWASMLGGVAVAGSALRSDGGKLKMLLGIEMIRRGFSGHCYAYQAFGIRSAQPAQGASISVPYELGVRARAAVTITKPRPV